MTTNETWQEARAEERRRQYTSPTAEAPIVVGFDGTDGGRDALELARVLSRVRRSPCVVAVPRTDGLAEEARERLDDPRTEVATIGVLSPGKMLNRLAEREHAGTLAIGASRADRLERAIVGTTGDQVLAHAPCEVAFAPRGYAESRHESIAKIAVAVDGTPESKVALTRAEDLARQAGATIEVLVAEDTVVADVEALLPADAPAVLGDVLEAAIGAVDPTLSPTGRKLKTSWRKTPHATAAALAQAADVDLLVAGSRRQLERVLSGSVTKHLAREAGCPVLVVPHSRQA